jgi:hypothetical protein
MILVVRETMWLVPCSLRKRGTERTGTEKSNEGQGRVEEKEKEIVIEESAQKPTASCSPTTPPSLLKP